MKRRLLVCVGALGAFALGLPDAATAATLASQSYATTGEHQFVVPAGVTSLQVTLVGGVGGNGYDVHGASSVGGQGATVAGTLTVTAGETLFVEVAGDGEMAGAASYDGGGAAGTVFLEATGGGSGGGASDIRTCSMSVADPADPADCATLGSLQSRLLVAAGGGGGGGENASGTSPGSDGGGAGGPGAVGGEDDGQEGGEGGAAGGQGRGGAGGANSDVGAAGEGLLGQGGIGGKGGFNGGGGGGGGGGIYGGGGGGGGDQALVGDFDANGAGGGGGGGSSGVPTGVTRALDYALEQTALGAQPSATLTWTLPPPAAVTGATSSVTSTTATLNGTVNPDGSSVSSCDFSIAPAPPSGATIPCLQQVGAGSTPFAVTAALAGLSPGTTYTVTLAATSAQGSSNGGAVTFTTPPQPNGSAPGANNAGPVLSALTLSPSRFRRGTYAATLATHAHKGIPVGTTISFTLSQTATVTLTFQHVQPGIPSAGRCLAASPKRRHGRRCTRYTTAHGSVSIAVPAGADRLGFDGLLADSAKLAPGSYRLVLSASDANGTTTAAQHPAFTLLGAGGRSG